MAENTEEGVRADLPDWARSSQVQPIRATHAGRAVRVDIGRVISRTFGAIGANFLTFFLLTVLLASIPALLIGIGAGFLTVSLAPELDMTTLSYVAAAMNLGAALLAMVPAYLAFGALTQGSIVHYSGGKASFGECLSTGFSFLAPLLGLGFLTIIGLFLWLALTLIPAVLVVGAVAGIVFAGLQSGGGITAFAFGQIIGVGIGVVSFVPAILAAIRWSVSTQSLVVERTGVMGAFRRSGDLTRDSRWRIFWLALIWFVISYLIQFGFTFLEGSVAMQFGPTAVWAVYGATVLYSAISTMILASGQAALYYELRTAKEGITSDQLAKVFE